MNRRRALLAADYDLVIRGGRVIDPAQRFDGLADVAITGGKVAAVGRDLAVDIGVGSLDARGKLVVPGLVDVHVHARDAELPPEHRNPRQQQPERPRRGGRVVR